MHAHHRKRRSQGGDDTWGNKIDLPPEIHEAVHREPEIAYQHGLLVRETDDPGAIRPDIPGFMASLGMEGEPAKPEKPKRQRKQGADRKSRPTISVKVPKDEQENGGEVWDDLFGDGKDGRPLGRVRERLDAHGLDGSRSPYYLIVDVANDWLNS